MDGNQSPDTILEEALKIVGLQAREAYLEEVCGDDTAMREDVDSLLAAHFAAEGFMEPSDDQVWLPQTEKEGDWIGRYRLLELIGEGGFGRVWMAEQREPMERKVALKIVKLGMDTGQVVARFEAERQALAMMDHANIAHVYDGGATENGRPYFVMELVRGVPITTYCDANKLTPRARIDLFRKVCEAVQHAHLKGIIHRDLKPSNILVTVKDDKPVLKVIDFGVAKALQKRLTERTLFTRMAQWVGTPEYMSPEQAGLGSHDVDTRSDVYTLGVILYELLTGRTPFGVRELREEGYENILRTIREEDAPKPSTRLSSLSREELSAVADHRGESPEKLGREIRGEIDWILLKALERDRSRRYESANQLAEELRRLSANEPIAAVPPSFTYRVRKYVRKHPRQLAMAAAGILAMLAATVLITWKIATMPVPPGPFPRTGKAHLATLRGHEERVNGLVLSPTESILASSSIDGTIKFWDSETGELLADLSDDADRVWSIAFSPDGETLASTGDDGRILLWDVGQGTPRRVWHEPEAESGESVPDESRRPVVFSPDGKTLATVGLHNPCIYVWDVKSGTVRSRIPAPGNRFSGPNMVFSPDGTVLAVAHGWVDTSVLALWHIAERRFLWSMRGDARKVTALAFSPDGKLLATGNADCTVRIRRVVNGSVTATIRSPHDTSWITAVAFSPDGRSLAAARFTNISIWDLETGGELAFLNRHFGEVRNLIYYPDGRTLASAGLDRDIIIWDVPAAMTILEERHKAHETETAEEEGDNTKDDPLAEAIDLFRLEGTSEAAQALSRLYASGSEADRLRIIFATQQLKPSVARQVLQREIVARDEFGLDPTLEWEVRNSDATRTRLDRNEGILTIRAQDGDLSGPRDDFDNVFLIPNSAKGRDFQLTTSVIGFTPKEPWQLAALLCWNDADNYVKLSYEAGTVNPCQVVLIPESGGRRLPWSSTALSAGSGPVWLRLTRVGNYYGYASSRDGESFKPHGSHLWKGGEPDFVGLMAIAPGDPVPEEVDVTFDFFEVATLLAADGESPPTE